MAEEQQSCLDCRYRHLHLEKDRWHWTVYCMLYAPPKRVGSVFEGGWKTGVCDRYTDWDAAKAEAAGDKEG